MGKSSDKKTQTYTPNPLLSSAYSSLIPQAQSLSAQPLQLYQGNLVAPFSDAQNNAFSAINAAQGAQTPYINAAFNATNAGMSPITPTAFSSDALNQYMSPYTQDVVNATQAQFYNQNRQAQNDLAEKQMAAGAWGGDRAGIGAAELANQQDLAQAPVIAGLYNQGFNTALGEFNTQQQAGMQGQEATAQNALNAGYELGGLGNEALSTALTGASAELNAGNLQQGLAQEQLNVPYEQYLQQQAYPYQQMDFLASILGDVGQNLGYKATTKETGSSFSLARGGRPHHFDGGGLTSTNEPPFWLMSEGFGNGQTQNDGGLGMTPTALPATPASKVPNVAQGYIPQQPSTPGTAGNPFSGNSGGQGGGGGQGKSGGLLGDLSSAFGSIDKLNQSPAFNNTMDWLGNGIDSIFGSGTAAGGSSMFADIGSTLADAGTAALAFLGLEDGGRARHLDDGGDSTPPPIYSDPDMGPMGGSDRAASPDETPRDWHGQVTHFAAHPEVIGGGLKATKPEDESFWQRIGLAPTLEQNDKGNFDYDPGWGHAILKGLGTAATSHHLLAGIADAVREHDLDRKPELDHSGPTSLLRFSDGTTIDTGMPTESALNAQYMRDYREATLGNKEENFAEKQAEFAQHEKDRQAQLEVARITAGGTWQYVGIDPATNRPMLINTRTGEQRLGGAPIGAKPTAADSGPPALAAPWTKYGPQGASESATAPPPLPPSVPPGSQWSPSRRQFRDPKGKLYNEAGQPLP